jgi:hypothetical protein
MRRFIAIGLASLLMLANAPQLFAAAQATGALTGVARTTAGQALADHSVRVRDVRTGDVVATSRTGANGTFLVAALQPGSYVVEIVDVAGRIVGVSTIATVMGGSTATLTVTAVSTSLVGGRIGAVGISAIIAASALGITGLVMALTGDEASPSQ